MKMVTCKDCLKEVKFTDASPCWDLTTPGPPTFICPECGKDVPRLESIEKLPWRTRSRLILFGLGLSDATEEIQRENLK
jgi:NAD-dependent SIR2 family protein deacetylase